MLPRASDGTDGAQKRCYAKHIVPQNERGGEASAPDRTPGTSGAQHDRTTGPARLLLLFALVAPGGAVHTVLQGSRGGRPSSPHSFTFHFLPSGAWDRSSSARPGTAG